MRPKRIDANGALVEGYASGQVFHSVSAQTSGLSNAQANIVPPPEARLVIVDVFMSGQTLLIASGANGSGVMEFAVNWTRNDGTTNYYHPSATNVARDLIDGAQHMGNWQAQFRLMQSHLEPRDWVGYIDAVYGHTMSDSLTNMNGSHLRFKGRLVTRKEAGQGLIKFGTMPGESGFTSIKAVAIW